MGTKKNTGAHAKRKIRNTVIMEKTNFNSELAYKKAKKRQYITGWLDQHKRCKCLGRKD